MRREPHIPLFLWVTAALVAHALGGGGATEIVQRLEETLDIQSFASEVRAKAKFVGPVEVTIDTGEAEEEKTEEELEKTDAPLTDSDEVDPTEIDPAQNESEAKSDEDLEAEARLEEEKLEEEKKAEEKEQATEPPKEEEEKEKPPELLLDKKPPPKILPDRRVAVEQHVKDENQEDNPDAAFAGEHANRVKEETQAKITSTDQNAQDPSVGAAHAGSEPEPGNSDESKVAQSDENDSPEDASPGVVEPAAASAAAAAAAARAGVKAEPPTQALERNAQAAREAKAASDETSGMPETHTHRSGSYSTPTPQEASAAQQAQKAREARARLLALQNKPRQPLLGYGSSATTERGVSLNLSQNMAHAVIGQDHLNDLKHEAGKRRLSKHRGSWQSVGLERWRGAIENYVANVQPGNQTALNTARVPFARYLNQIHQRLHEVFAHGFLVHLDGLPDDHPLNNKEMSTHLEIALSPEDGRIVKLGVVKSSGVTAFDVGALESVSKAAPYGVPPGSIVSSDGNVYLHWEFYRNHDYACSTYFAHPYLINTGPKPAVPRVDPPRKPNYDEKKPDERSGALEPKSNPRGIAQPG